jgi:hypothetical protein
MRLLDELTTSAAPRDRALSLERARARREADERRIVERARKQTEDRPATTTLPREH